MHRLDRVSKYGGGVAIYAKNTFKHRIPNQMNYVVYDLLECLSIELVDLSKIKIIVACKDRQPDTDIYDLVNNYETRFRKRKKNYIYMENST